MKLLDLPQRQNPRPRIYGLSPNGHEDGYIEFDHIDGMYSYCVAYDGAGNRLGVCHLKAWTPLDRCEDLDGYRIADAEGKL